MSDSTRHIRSDPGEGQADAAQAQANAARAQANAARAQADAARAQAGAGHQQLSTQHANAPHVDAQGLSGGSTEVYEAVATLEYAGQRPSRPAIAAAVSLDPKALDDVLAALVDQGLLTAAQAGGETVFEPARRDWSTQPGQPAGHPMD